MRTGQPKSLAEVLLNLEPAQSPVRPAELVAESPQAHTEPPETPATEEQDGNPSAAERGATSPAEASACTPLNGDHIAAPPVKDGAPRGQVWLGAPEIGSVDVLAAASDDAPPRRARRIGRVLAVSAVSLGLLSLGFVLGVNLDRSDTDVSTRSSASAEAS